jgi:hypothetical protein
MAAIDPRVIRARTIEPTRNAHGLPRMSRRQLLRASVWGSLAVLTAEWLGGSLAFFWGAATAAGSRVRIGTLDELIGANSGLPVVDGYPAYVPAAGAFVTTLDPLRGGWTPGVDPTGDGTALNVRALSQICPHLGCRPNPCPEDFWFHCPCHQSRYDRKGIKPEGTQYGPADRSMDRFPIEVSKDGVLFVDTSRVILGPLPIALGQPGVELPLVARGCGG